MADEDYQNRIRELQRYVPFLDHTIKRLKSETGKLREAQISKLQSLLEILTDTKKKLKYDALRKCEEVILKLYEKVEKKPPSETMHKYMCRNPPDDKFPFDSHDSSPNLDSDVAFSVARQKLSKQADLTPASPSPPPENSVATRPVVIPTEKVQNEFNTQSSSFTETLNVNQTLNWPTNVFNSFPVDKNIRPPFSPPNWKNEQLYFRRNEINPRPDIKNSKFNIWNNKDPNLNKSTPIRRELIDYSDTFGVDTSPKLEETKIVPTSRIIAKQDRIVREYLEEQKKIQLLKSPSPPKLNKPPLTESDLQDLLLSTPSSTEDSPPLVNEDMDLDKLEELKAKLYKELEESKEDQLKVSKPAPVMAPKPKVIERVIKEQDNIFGNLLSSIDEQIMNKKDAKKNEKKHKSKEIKTKLNPPKPKPEKKREEKPAEEKEKTQKEDEKVPNSGRLSDKYPHKRKPSIDKPEKPGKPEPVKEIPPKVITPKKPLTTEVHPAKLQDPRLKHTPFPELKCPNFGPVANKPPNLGPFSPPHDPFLGNRTPRDPFAIPLDHFPNNLGNMTPGDPFSTNYDVDMREQIPFPNNFNQNEQFRPNRDHFRPNPEQFYQFRPNRDLIRPGPDHFRNNFRPNDQFRRHPINEDQFRPNFSPRFPNQNIVPRNFHENQPPEQNFNPYDLSQMNPIDFYENDDQRSFRGRGGHRGNYCPNRGHFRNVQWVNPIVRDETRREDPKDDRRKPPRRFHREEKPQNESKREDPRKKKPEEKEEKPKVETIEPIKPKEEISSPLDSLYSAVTKPVIGKGYGIQNFRIPKIKKSEIKEEKKDEVKNEIETEESKSVEDDTKVEEIVEEVKVSEESKSDEVKKDDEKEAKVDKETKAEPSSSKEETESPPTEADEKLVMFNKFMKHIFDTCDSSFLLQYLDKCGISIPQSKTKRIRRIIDSDSESEDEEIPKEEETKQAEEIKIEETSPTKEPDVKTPEKVPEELESDVVESVGERIKNRRRKHIIYSSDSSPEKPLVINEENPNPVMEKKITRKTVKKTAKTKRKSALELLQEDLRDMFISEGVLTATGKRMCRMMKEHEEQGLYKDLNDSKTKENSSEDDDIPLAQRKNFKNPKKTSKTDPKPEVEDIKIPQRRLRSSPRVLLEKINIPASKSSDEETSADETSAKKDETIDTTFAEPEIPAEIKPKRRRRGRRSRKNRKKRNTNSNSNSVESSTVSLSTNDSETTETETIESETTEEKPEKKKLVKKKNSWAHGVIKRNSKRKINKNDRSTSSLSQNTEISDQLSEEDLPQLSLSQNSDDDEYSLLKIDLKPDVYYFLDNGNKFDCKLCHYKGKFIVHHYRTRHPESENMISRLNPDQAEKAQTESKDNKFEEIEPFEETENGKKLRTTFICRFCNISLKKEIVPTFFDHVACHTGEYRYSCELCPFFSGNKKTLSGHCYNIHPELKKPLNLTPGWPSPPNFRIMFGFMCSACNFTQLLKENVEKHIKVSHLGQNIEIIKINMSSKSVSVKDLQKIETKLDEKEPDMTAFLEPDDISLREQLIEEERRKKMEEIASNITPRRSTLQFVDQLKNKLQNALNEETFVEIEQTDEEVAPPEDFRLKICSTISLAETEPESNNEDTIRIASTCSLAGLESSSPEIETENEIDDSQKSSDISEEEMDITNVELTTDSKQKGVLDTIQRLAAKLQNPNNPEPETAQTQFEQVEIKEEEKDDDEIEKIISVGAIEVRIKNKEQNYICKIPNCNFSSLYKISFTKHCADVHTKITVLCEICARDNTFNYLTMTSLFVHLFDVHKNNAKITKTPAKIRIRRISGDILSKPTETDPLQNNCEPTEPISQNTESDMSFLQIKDVRTLTEEEEHNLQPNLQIIQQPNLAIVRQNTKKIMIPIHELSKYVSVKHTATSFKKKPIATSTENVIWYKTKKIFNEMLIFPKILDIYKCPIEFCSFSSAAQKDFKVHMISHKWCQITVCVYCREGISSNNLISHIDTFHSHCTLQCAFCFYRTISKTYLMDHQKNVHKHNFDTLVEGFYYQLSPAKMTPVLYEIPARNLMIFPYQCIQGSCTQKFLIADDFMVHLHVYHKKYFMCAVCDDRTVYFITAQTLIQHYAKHNIAHYQCQYCVCGSHDVDTMLSHYAMKHQHLEPICYIRQYKNKNNGAPKTLDDIILINMETNNTVEPVKPNNTIQQLPKTSTIIENKIQDEQTASTSENSDETDKIIELDIKDAESDSSKIIDVVDLSEDNSQFNEPYVILKHRNIESKNAVENAIDPLLLIDNSPTEEITNLSDTELYKCGTINCNFRSYFLSDFKSHLFICDVMSNSYNCVHCETKFASVIALCEHIQIHGEKRFSCGICDFKSSLGQQIVKHMKESHNVITIKFHPLDPSKKDMSRDYFVVESINKDTNKKKDPEKSILKTTLEEKSEKLMFTNLFGPENLQNQSEKRFTCEICKYHAYLGQDIVQHMKDIHDVHYTQFHPEDPLKKDLSKDHFTVRAILKKNIDIPSPKDDEIKDNKVKNIFGPEDIDSLPRPPVYASEIKCKLCNYNTKVRSNMQRHLQQHIDEKAVPETAPVNPVPCLEKNEKMFDKMTNLAASSHYGRMGGKPAEKSDKTSKEDDKIYPGFIPVSKRFVCGAFNCNYLTHGDQMLRHHLTALHADETIYKCPHCQMDIPSEIDGLEIDQIVFHLKMHDLHLYKCPDCQFFHYQKHKIERHISDNHPESNGNIVIIRELDSSANFDNDRPTMPVNFTEPVQQNLQIQQHLWKCGYCDFKCRSRGEIQKHTNSQHGIKSQYKCGKCKFRCSAKTNFIVHFKKLHPEFDGDPEIETVYYKMTEEQDEQITLTSSSSHDDINEIISSPIQQNFDTTPIWVKNKTGVKHIRGILLEETKSSPKKTPKIIEKLEEIKSQLSETITVDEITKNLFSPESEPILNKNDKDLSDCEITIDEGINSPSKLNCKHCDFVAKTTRTLRKHQKRHFSHYPFKCNNCDFQALSVQSIAHHHRAKHKSGEVSYTEIPASETILELSLKRKRHESDEKPTKVLITIEEDTNIVEIDEENKQTYYVCLHCPRKSNELDKIRSHFYESHARKTSTSFKYKKIIMDKTKKLHYKCNYCDWFGDPTSLKNHCSEVHSDQTWVPQRNTKLKCTICDQIFSKIKPIRKHFNGQHPKENLSFFTLLEDGNVLDRTEFFEEEKQELIITKCNYCSDQFENKNELMNHHSLLHSHLEFEEDELKKFKCPECAHSSNSYAAMKMHLRRHNRPFLCSYCSAYFYYPSHVKSHHVKMHGDLPLVINEAPEIKKQMEKLAETMLYLNQDGTYTPKNKLKRSNSTDLDEPPTKVLILDELNTNASPPVKRNVAKKSTSLPAIPKNVAKKSTANRVKNNTNTEFSFYGSKPCDINDYKNVMSEINIMGKIMPINVVAMSHVLNLFPNVPLTDIKNQKTL